jgi:hypothetical protein
MPKHTTKNTPAWSYITVTTATKGKTTRAGMPARVATQQQRNKKKRDKKLQHKGCQQLQ